MSIKYAALNYSPTPTDPKIFIGWLYEDINSLERDFASFHSFAFDAIEKFDPDVDIDILKIAVETIVKNFQTTDLTFEQYIKPFVNSLTFDPIRFEDNLIMESFIKGEQIHPLT